MKSVRNLYVIVSSIVAVSLLAVSLAEGMNCVVTPDWRFASYLQWLTAVAPVCGVIGAAGVILLGWHWLKLTAAIDSMAKLLEQDRSPHIKPGNIAAINELSSVISHRFEGHHSRLAQLESQIEESKLQIQLLGRQKRNTEAIIYSIRDAVIVTDEFDRLVMANRAAEELFNFDFDGSQYKPIAEVMGPQHCDFVDFLRQSRQSKGQHTRREIDFAKHGVPKTFDCIVSCVCEQSEGGGGAVAVLHDITREKEISQMKNDFVSHVSHELKTPLASISAYAEMLVEGEADNEETRKEFYSVIQNQAKRLNRLIEDILNVSRIESGLIKVEKKPVSVTMLIEEQLQMIKTYAEEKNIEIIRRAPIVFDQAYVDRDMISQVIVNLLSNAVKYTPSGGSVRVETEVDEIRAIVQVSVIDTGVGIPENELPHIFDKFYRVGANKQQAKGTGLGLNLVRQIVEKVHGGRVFVSSKCGEGSTFGFELPLVKAGAMAAVSG